MSETTVTGTCLCGDVQWQAEGPLRWMSHCHCSMCRRFHGTAFATFVAAPVAGFRLTRGAEAVRAYESSPGFQRHFCGRCGSAAPPPEPEGEQVFLPAGNLDAPVAARPEAHIYVGSRAPWYEIADAVPRFDVMPPGFDAPAVEAPAPERPDEPGAVRGRCLCGAVAYELGPGFEVIVCCHCSRCRRGRSAAHATNLFGPGERFRWVRGGGLVQRFRPPDAERFHNCFCGECGSIVPRGSRSQDGRGGNVGVPAGGVEGDPGARPRMHIFVDSKADWFEIADELPRFPEAPPGRR